jgi:predicted GNAT family acetyltransferase
VGYRLVQATVDFARANKIKIFPLYPFANAVFKKKAAEFGDVLSRN